ncbi:hypothetical protein ACFL6S_36745 [Candidatus Poribacteria bacterium]
MSGFRIIISLLAIVLVICPSSLFAATIWAAAENFDELVDDPGDGVEAFTFEGRDALTGGGIYFTSNPIVQGVTDTTSYEYDLVH